jgi:DnaJ-class molecular chaperone
MPRTASIPIKPRVREAHVCAFCHGRGVDPFNAMSDRSTCGSCQGKGTVEVPVPHVRCAYCSGSGSHKTYRCLVCGGAGVVAAPTGPTRSCLECGGEGCEPSSKLPCLACKGRGVVPC